jgi:hypothetical protein
MKKDSDTFIVSHGEQIVQLDSFGLTESEAKMRADQLSRTGARGTRIRLEDPIHPSWPKHFDLN